MTLQLLTIDACVPEKSLDDTLKKFWGLSPWELNKTCLMYTHSLKGRYCRMMADMKLPYQGRRVMGLSVAPGDRDALHFLWIDDIKKEQPRVTTFRFTRVVFGISASPFLLNATIKHHIEKYTEKNPQFVNLLICSIYVDDITYGASDKEAAFELYSKSKKVLAEGGFNLRKFTSNSQSLQGHIEASEGRSLAEAV